MKIATWNVRSLYEMTKTECAIKEMKRLNIDVVGISEMRWKGSGSYCMPEHKIYFAGNDERYHWRGVGFIVTKRIETTVKIFVPISDRVALLQLNGQGVQINLMQVYAPTTDAAEDEVDAFYEDIKEGLKKTRSEDVNIVMGDFNAKVGAGNESEVTGRWGLGERNERDDRMIQFCQEENFIVANTYFQLPARRLYTWRAPSDSSNHRVRNQIDYIMITL